MKKFFTLLGCLLVAAGLTASAATYYKSVIFEHADSHLTRLTIESGMVTKLADSQFLLTSSKGEITYPMSDIRNWSFSTEAGVDSPWAGIDTPAIDSALDIIWTSTGITVGNLPQASSVSLTGIDGKVLLNATASDTYTVRTSELTPGVYVLTVNHKSFKIAINR